MLESAMIPIKNAVLRPLTPTKAAAAAESNETRKSDNFSTGESMVKKWSMYV